MAVTLSKYGSSINRLLCHLAGLSTDTKPIGTYADKSGKVFLLENGSSFEEMDTDKKYLYDAENQQWNLASSGGGGGGSATLIEKSITENGVYNASDDSADGYSKVTVNVSSGGGTSQPRKDVNFYDYDGTIVNSYTAAEFAELSAMPANPSHEGLTAQGWNWSLADAKIYVADYGKLEIGQMYITSDGKTRLYITLPEGRTSPVLQLYLNANSELDIDWGDGSTHSTFTSTTADYKSERHNYANAKDYVIAITITTGSFEFNSSSSNISSILWNENDNLTSPDRAYNNSIQKIEIGTGMTSIGNYAFRNVNSLSSITIPNSVSSIGFYAFNFCYSLSSITIPNSVSSVGQYAFQSCSSLSTIALPNHINIGQYAFQNCYSLLSITLTSSTSIGEYAFQSCVSLSSITIPNSVSSVGQYAFQNCYSLSSITLSNSINIITNSMLRNCGSLSSITIPNLVTNIFPYAFSNCSYMEYIKFEATTPPTVSNSNTWSNLSTSTKILVPTGTLETYKSANNYPNSSTYTYVEY